MKNTNIQAISLFSGAGGLDIGIKQNNNGDINYLFKSLEEFIIK